MHRSMPVSSKTYSLIPKLSEACIVHHQACPVLYFGVGFRGFRVIWQLVTDNMLSQTVVPAAFQDTFF